MSNHQKESELERVWSVISHDLATPLFVMQSNLKHLDKELMPMLLEVYQKAKDAGVDIPPKLDKLLQNHKPVLPETQSAVHRIRQLISRWNRKLLPEKFQPSKEPVNIKPCVEAAIKEYQALYRLEDKSRIHVDIDEATVLGDETMIQHILYELLANAEYAIEAGDDKANHTLVSISSVMDDEHYHLQIKSNGSAIDETNLSKLFDPYFSTKTSHIGLGLTFCQRTLQRMEGKLSCRTENDGKTAIFTLTAKKHEPSPKNA